jgi:hypothetical protein
MNTKRIAIATVLGLVCGVICLCLGHYAGGSPWSVLFVASGLVNRGMMGFVIGATGVRGNAFLRGAIWGALMSIGPALASGFGPDKFVPYMVAGTIYGLLIDALTSKAFKADVTA